MNAWTRTIISLTLICYVAVSSVAAAHAFPSSLSTTGSSDLSLRLSLAEMGPNCHQQKSNDEEPTVTSVCKIFCAAMSNIIIDDLAIYQSGVKVGQEIAFLIQDVSTLTFAMEPHPPK